jgi:hypothetical protein
MDRVRKLNISNGFLVSYMRNWPLNIAYRGWPHYEYQSLREQWGLGVKSGTRRGTRQRINAGETAPMTWCHFAVGAQWGLYGLLWLV